MSRKFSLFFTLLFLSLSLIGESDDPERFLREKNLEGSFFLKEIATGREYVVNPEDVDRATLPASTFKIVNSLIGIETGVVKDPSDLFPWDGVERPIKAWNQDLSLAQAIKVSSVPVYQELARRIGKERMERYLSILGYGRGGISAGIDQFWLRGDFGVTPREQVEFLTRLYQGKLPLAERTQKLVKGMILLGEREGVRLSGKTGTVVFQDQRRIGWLVGWVKSGDGRVGVFSLRIRSTDPGEEFLSLRISLAKRYLSLSGFALPEGL